MLEESPKQLRKSFGNLWNLLPKGLMEMLLDYGRINSVLDYMAYLLNQVLLTNIRATRTYNISVTVDYWNTIPISNTPGCQKFRASGSLLRCISANCCAWLLEPEWEQRRQQWSWSRSLPHISSISDG